MWFLRKLFTVAIVPGELMILKMQKKLKINRKRFADFLEKFFHKSISIDEVKTTSQCEKGPFNPLDQKETINLKKKLCKKINNFFFIVLYLFSQFFTLRRPTDRQFLFQFLLL